MSKKLIVDTYIPKRPILLEKHLQNIDKNNISPDNLISSTNGMFRGLGICKGAFQEADVLNQNGRIYPAKLLERKIKEFAEESVKEQNAIGELDHPRDDRFSPELHSGALAISEIYYDPVSKLVLGEYTILPTSSGRDLLAYHISNVKIGVSARGVGSLVPDYGKMYESNGDFVAEIVQDDYMLSTYDAVSKPSYKITTNTEVKLKESLEVYNLINSGKTEEAYYRNGELAGSWEQYWDNIQSMLEFIEKNGLN